MVLTNRKGLLIYYPDENSKREIVKRCTKYSTLLYCNHGVSFRVSGFIRTLFQSGFCDQN